MNGNKRKCWMNCISTAPTGLVVLLGGKGQLQGKKEKLDVEIFSSFPMA